MAPTRNMSHPPERDPTHIPRPPNCFILYRADKLAKLRLEAREVPGCSPRDKRALISKMWQEEPDEVQEYWRQVADQRAAEHKEAYPNYKYQPRRKKRPTAAHQGYGYETPGTDGVQTTGIPLLPVPALVPSCKVEENEVDEVGTMSSASRLSSPPGQSCTIISPSFIRPSPNFSFLTLDDPATSTSANDMPSKNREISLPNVPSFHFPSSSMHAPVSERPIADPMGHQFFQPDYTPFSSDMLGPSFPHTVHGMTPQYPQNVASGMQDDVQMELVAHPTVPPQNPASWVPDDEIYRVEPGRTVVLDPSTSAVPSRGGADNCLLDMVSSLLFLPENMLSNLYF